MTGCSKPFRSVRVGGLLNENDEDEDDDDIRMGET